ncbi:MAG TPA: hypothetical protein VMF87_22180, partial [Streptosporangiaceae bacterium]|nr:hypothetical protein [Streptosporangiaceae bacterium]
DALADLGCATHPTEPPTPAAARGGLKKADEESRARAGRPLGWAVDHTGRAGRSQLCVWYDLIVDDQVNVF